MENGKRKVENAERNSAYEKFSTSNFSLSACSACGAEAQRDAAKYCLVCGKFLNEGFQPLDTLRASYRLQGKSFDFKEEVVVTDLFEQNKNQISQTAWACLVYSMVPYLGILFIPFTLFIGGFGYVVALRQPHLGGRKLALVSISISFVVLAVQVFLWWLLFIVPELGK